MTMTTLLRMLMAGLDDYSVMEPIIAELEDYYSHGPIAELCRTYRQLEVEDKLDQMEDELQQAYDAVFREMTEGIELE